MTTAAVEAALPYHEPDIITILTLSSFLLLLNLANHVVDKLLYCGLLAQILLGIAFGTPGGAWLGQDTEHTVVNLGYLGLLLIVYEGGLLTNFTALKNSLLLSIGVAATGICLPIAASYVLLCLLGATAIQAFAAGAALCSTSLGTTFAVLAASGLTTTRMGTVLASAAMMDDVVGLVMVQVISNLGTASAFTAVSVVRPALVAVAFVVVVPLAARLVAQPLTLWLNDQRTAKPGGYIHRVLSLQVVPWIMHTTILIGLVTGAVYAGTSGLFAAYLAGASITWWDTAVPHWQPTATRSTSSSAQVTGAPPSPETGSTRTQLQAVLPSSTGVATFERYFATPLQRILKPFFFASIGFSIPITRMFAGNVVWKGIIYTVLMFTSKFVCGLWLMRLPGLSGRVVLKCKPKAKVPPPHAEKAASTTIDRPTTNGQEASNCNPSATSKITAAPPQSNEARTVVSKHRTSLRAVAAKPKQKCNKQQQTTTTTTTPKPVSLYPGCILGCAMVARGEIGFLISSIAETQGVFGDEPNGPIFLVVTWAIMLCTFIGPLLVGVLVRRVKRLERGGGGTDICGGLGIWGVS